MRHDLVLFENMNKGGYVLQLVAEIEMQKSIRFLLRTFNEAGSDYDAQSYVPTLEDFREMGILLLGLSEFAKETMIWDEYMEFPVAKELFLDILENLAADAFETKDFLQRKKKAKKIKQEMGLPG